MKKTALTELIEELTESAGANFSTELSKVYRMGLLDAINKAKALLPKEREDILKAYSDGRDDCKFRDEYNFCYWEITFEQ